MLTTSTTLLEGLHDRDNIGIWREFCLRYREMLIAFGVRLGLTGADAEDTAQNTLVAFVSAYRRGEYQRQQGRLRTWLSGIARHKIADHKRKRWDYCVVVGGAETSRYVDQIADDHTVDDIWETEWRRAILKKCLKLVREEFDASTMMAFELSMLNDWKVGDVADHLGVSRGAVYHARSRVPKRMREIAKSLEEDW
jgi:RNA polymerase sigma factor (sigma-70 family)